MAGAPSCAASRARRAASTSTRATPSQAFSTSSRRPAWSTRRRTTPASSAGLARIRSTSNSHRARGAAARTGCRSPTRSST
jgi:hypothetical protein